MKFTETYYDDTLTLYELTQRVKALEEWKRYAEKTWRISTPYYKGEYEDMQELIDNATN